MSDLVRWTLPLEAVETEQLGEVALTSNFGERLRSARLRLRLSQADLASAGVSASYISLLEAGRRTPTREVAERLAGRLNVDVDELLDGVSPERAHQGRLDLAFARLCLQQGDPSEARTVLERLLLDGGLAADADRLFDARLALAEALERLGDLDQAVRALEALREEALQQPTHLPWLPIVVALSRCYRESGDLHRAVDVAEAAYDEAQQLGLQGLAAFSQVVATLALAYYERGDLLRAATLLNEQMDVGNQADRQAQAAAYWNGALVASGRGRHAEAARLAEQATVRLTEGEDERLLARLKTTRAYILLAMQPPDPLAALQLLDEALPALRQYDSQGAVASALVEVARSHHLLGDAHSASEQAQAALDLLGSDSPLEIARARAVLGEAQVALGQPREARTSMATAAELLEALGASRHAAAAWRALADGLLRVGDHAAAIQAYQRALGTVGLPGDGVAGTEALSRTVR